MVYFYAIVAGSFDVLAGWFALQERGGEAPAPIHPSRGTSSTLRPEISCPKRIDALTGK